MNPGLAEVPFVIVEGVPLSPREALEYLERKEKAVEISRVVATLALNLREEQLQLLCEEHYRRLASLPPPRPVIVWIGGKLTFEQALEEVRRRTPRGKVFVGAYGGLLAELSRRLG